MIDLSRRKFITLSAGLLVAPAIVRASSIMKVRPVIQSELYSLSTHVDFAPVIGQIRETKLTAYSSTGSREVGLYHHYWDGTFWQPCDGGRIPEPAITDMIARGVI